MQTQKLLPAIALGVFLASPAVAEATLSYTTAPFNATVFVANDDGSGAHKVAAGHNPHVAPDGLSVAYLHEGPKNAQELKHAPATGGPGKTVMANLREAFDVAWSPDSKTIAALRGPELGKRKLVLIDVGAQRPVAGTGETGFVGADLSADGFVVLGFNGGFDPGLKNHKVQTVPYSGGKPKTLVKEAIEPSWNR